MTRIILKEELQKQFEDLKERKRQYNQEQIRHGIQVELSVIEDTAYQAEVKRREIQRNCELRDERKQFATHKT